MEYIDIVDRNDTVIGVAPKYEANDKHLGHRIVHVLLFDDSKKMALQLRGKKLYFCPDHWSTAVGGYVHKGETYETAALREFEEELGVGAPLTLLGKDIYDTPENGFKILQTYTAIYTGKFHLDPHEVQRVEYFTLDQIRDMIARKEKFHPELLYLLKKYFTC